MFQLFSFIEHKKNLEKHGKVCNDDDCCVEMSNDNYKIFKKNCGEKSMKAPFVIYAYLECLLEKMHSCQNNPKKSSREKIKHTPSG